MCVPVQVARLVNHLSNGAFMLSEQGGDPVLNSQYGELLALVPLEHEMVSWCAVWLPSRRGWVEALCAARALVG